MALADGGVVLEAALVGQQSAFPYLLYLLLFRFSPELLLQIVDC